MAAHRRTASDVRSEAIVMTAAATTNQSDGEDGHAGGPSEDTDEIDLEADEQHLLSLVPNNDFIGKTF